MRRTAARLRGRKARGCRTARKVRAVPLINRCGTGPNACQALVSSSLFSKHFNQFMARRCYPIPDPAIVRANLIPASFFLSSTHATTDQVKDAMIGDRCTEAEVTVACSGKVTHCRWIGCLPSRNCFVCLRYLLHHSHENWVFLLSSMHIDETSVL